jgi:hypothetical protein
MCTHQNVQMHQYLIEYHLQRYATQQSTSVWDALGTEGASVASSNTEYQVASVLGRMGLDVVREWREPVTGECVCVCVCVCVAYVRLEGC